MWVNRYNPAVEKKLSGDIRIIRTLTSSLFVPIYYDNWESVYEKSNCRIGYELRVIMKSQPLYGGECHEFHNKKLFHSCLPNAQIPLNWKATLLDRI